MLTPTQRELARQAGVTVGTVSLALRNHPRISEATRQRIQKLADELGYHYDAVTAKLAAHLGTKRGKKERLPLAWVHDYPTAQPWNNNPYLKYFWEAGCERARQLGYRLDEFWLSQPGMTPARMEKILITRGIEGIILSVWPKKPMILRLPVQRFAVISTNFSVWRPQLDVVYPDLLTATMLCLKQLRRLGYQRIGLAIPGATAFRSMHESEAAYEYYSANQLIANRIPPYICEHYDAAPFFPWFKRYQPDAIISVFKGILEGWLPRLGVKVPQDVGYVEINWIPELTPARAGINNQPEAQARASVEFVVGKLHRHEYGVSEVPKVTYFEGCWVDGPTVRPQLQPKTTTASRRKRAARGLKTK